MTSQPRHLNPETEARQTFARFLQDCIAKADVGLIEHAAIVMTSPVSYTIRARWTATEPAHREHQMTAAGLTTPWMTGTNRALAEAWLRLHDGGKPPRLAPRDPVATELE